MFWSILSLIVLTISLFMYFVGLNGTISNLLGFLALMLCIGVWAYESSKNKHD